MTRDERNTKLKHFITCLKCEVGGRECDDNCPVQYEAGSMGEIIENLEAISKVLEQQTCENAVSRQAVIDALRDAENHAFNSYYKGLKEAHKIVADLPSAQPNMLDKIRTEIAAITINGQVDGHTMFIRTNEQVKQMALEIIDKYTAESEVRNDC